VGAKQKYDIQGGEVDQQFALVVGKMWGKQQARGFRVVQLHNGRAEQVDQPVFA